MGLKWTVLTSEVEDTLIGEGGLLLASAAEETRKSLGGKWIRGTMIDVSSAIIRARFGAGDKSEREDLA